MVLFQEMDAIEYDDEPLKAVSGQVFYNTSKWTLKNLLVAFPPVCEQIHIFHYLEKVSSNIDLAISIQQHQIEKLKEYKTTLIT